MRLYKFRQLGQQLDFVLDIIVNERFHCAEYERLNDPLEGYYIAEIPVSRNDLGGVYPVTMVSLARSASDDGSGFGNDSSPIPVPNVCSLSARMQSIAMWSLYASNHAGVAVEIESESLPPNTVLRPVTYHVGLPRSRQSFATAATVTDTLTRKTTEWEFEAEHRILHSENFISVAGAITAVFVGARASQLHVDILKRCTPPHVPLFQAKIDWHNAQVIRGSPLPRKAS